MSADGKTPTLAEEAPADETTDVVEEKSETPEMTEPSEKLEAEETNSAEEENGEASEETTDETPEIKIETAPADFRFPTTNQTRHCFTRYVEYHRCVAAKGEDAPECEKFAKYYRSLCPGEWVLYRCTGILRSWSILQLPGYRDLFTEACARLEEVARDIFIQHGWSHDLRIGPP